MTGERPGDATGPEDGVGPVDGSDDGREARAASAPDAPFRGLRSAADIFGAPREAEDWSSRRERREAERAARETGAPLAEPTAPAAEGRGVVVPEASGAPEPGPSGAPEPEDAGATQAIPMSDELRQASLNPQAAVEHERDTLGERIPPAAPVAPVSRVSHPSSISLPTAMHGRDQRAAENRAVDEERRRSDPFGQGRSDVDWLGRATGTQTPTPEPTPAGPVAQPIGVEGVLPSAPATPTNEPPSFTELLRLQGADDGASSGSTERPFDWAIRDDATGEVPTTLTSDRFDTTAFGAGSWSLADESDDDVVSGEVDTPAGGLPSGLLAGPGAAGPGAGGGAAAVAGAGAGAAAGSHAAPEPGGAETESGSGPTPTSTPTPSQEPEPDDVATTAMPAVSTPQRPGSHDQPPLGSDLPAPVAAATTPWWAEPEATVPPTAAPPLVEPAADAATTAYPAHLPPAVGQDLDGLAGRRRAGTDEHDEHDEHEVRGPAATDEPVADRLPAAAPEDLDQSEWDGRETSDTSAIKDLFGTEAVGQLGGTGYDPHDSGTRMMPAVGAAPDRAPAAGAPVAGASAPGRPPARAAATGAGHPDGGAADGDRDNFINEGFGRLRSEGRRGKQLLIVGAVVLIVVLLVAVFGLTRWILGNSISEEGAAATTATATATSAPSEPASPSPTQETTAPSAPAQTLQFATTPAAPGEHAWTDLAGSECLSPFANAWAETFTVVDCGAEHVAQLTARVQVDAEQWPGAEALAAQASEVCQSSQAIDTTAAASFGDVQVQGSYAPDQATWDRGNHFISCFATRSSGQPLTGSLAPNGT